LDWFAGGLFSMRAPSEKFLLDGDAEYDDYHEPGEDAALAGDLA